MRRLALWQDVRQSIRLIARHRGMALLAIVCLSLGIGIVATMFASADPWVFRPLPYADPDRLVTLREVSPRGRTTLLSAPLVADCRDEPGVLRGIGALKRTAYNLSTAEEPERVAGAAITPSMLSVLGVRPFAGRAFSVAEDRPSAPRVCVIGYDLWQRRFGGDRGAIGRTLRLDGEVHSIIGVMPPRWNFPEYAEVWTPLRLDPADRDRSARTLDVIARLENGVDARRAGERLAHVVGRAAILDPDVSGGWTVRVRRLSDALTPPGVRAALHLMLGAAGFVLLIACANVTNLLLALAIERRREMATRLALGATPGRLLRQVVIECLLLSAAGGALGLVLAWWATGAMAAWFGMRPPFWAEIGLTIRVALVTCATGCAAALISAFVPAMASIRQDVRSALQENGRTVSVGTGTRRLGAVVAASELAFAVVLLTGALLLVRSYAVRQALDPGFQSSNALTTRVTLAGERHRTAAGRYAFLRRVLQDVLALPGVDTAAAVQSLPFSDPTGGGWTTTAFEIEGQAVSPNRQPVAVVNAGTAAMLDAMGIPVAAGRGFLEGEVESGAPVALVNRRLADRFWPGGDAIGRRIRLTAVEWVRVVGIAGDVREPASILGIDSKPELQIYLPYTLSPSADVMLVVRGAGAIAGAPSLREVIRRHDPQLALYDVLPLDEARARADWVARLWGRLLSVGAIVGVLLACAGVYGVVTRTVVRRRQEIGIRMALGADSGQVVRLMLRGGLQLILGGVVAGIAGALALTRYLASLLYGVTASDPRVLAASALSLFSVAVIATYLPARLAARIDPGETLRSE